MMKQTVLLFGTLASALFFCPAFAADGETESAPPESRQRDDGQSGGRRSGRPGGWSREGRRGGMMMGAPVNPRAEAEAKIKEKFPEEYAAVEKMRAEAEAKLQELAKKAGVEIPKTMTEQLAELKAKFPKEMAEVEELGKTDRRAAFQKIRELAEKAGVKLTMPGMGGRPGMPGRNGSEDAPPPPPRENPMRQLRLLRQKFPEEMAEIDRLRRSDPEAARTKTRDLLKKLETEQPADNP